MKTLAIATDVHLNFVDRVGLAAFVDEICATRADGLLLTGDISEGPTLVQHLEVLHLGAKMPVYFVCGNHDFYRSSTSAVRRDLEALTRTHPDIHYLRMAVQQLSPTCALVGVDGWADARLGTPEHQRVELADWSFIQDYKDVSARTDLHARKELAANYADREALLLHQQLSAAVTWATRVLVLTHVPPFREATWHQGQHSDDDWLPWFSCKAVGDVLAAHAAKRSDVAFDVYCGHTHGRGTYQPSANLVVRSNAAVYGSPRVAGTLDV